MKDTADAQATGDLPRDVVALLLGFNGTTIDRLRSAADNGDAVAAIALGCLRTFAANMMYNGATWDRMRGDTTNGLDVDVTRIAAGENHLGEVAVPWNIVDATPVLDTSIYASGDVMWTAAVALTNLVRANDAKGIIRSVTVIDEDDQGVAMDLFFHSANVSLGTVNAAPSISDADARNTLGFVSVASGDYIDLGGARVAYKSGLAIPVMPASGTRIVYINGITRGTPTYTASGLRLRVGIEQG